MEWFRYGRVFSAKRSDFEKDVDSEKFGRVFLIDDSLMTGGLASVLQIKGFSHMAQTVTITTDEHRARNIAIGFAVIIVLTWWQITGSLPLLASSVIQDPQDGKVSSVQSFAIELLTDGLYMIGAFATAIFSGIWSLGVSLLKMLVSKTQAANQTDADAQKLIDARTEEIFKVVEEHLNQLDERIEKLESMVSVSSTPAPKRRASAVKS
jgi:hypothetical protein